MTQRTVLALVFFCVDAVLASDSAIRTSPASHSPTTDGALGARIGDDWPTWRGRNGNGVADGPPPPVPGRGHRSPPVVGQRVFLPTAEDDRQVQSVLAFERTSGDVPSCRSGSAVAGRRPRFELPDPVLVYYFIGPGESPSP